MQCYFNKVINFGIFGFCSSMYLKYLPITVKDSKYLVRDWGDGSVGENICFTIRRTRVQLLSIHIKADIAKYFCNINTGDTEQRQRSHQAHWLSNLNKWLAPESVGNPDLKSVRWKQSRKIPNIFLSSLHICMYEWAHYIYNFIKKVVCPKFNVFKDKIDVMHSQNDLHLQIIHSVLSWCVVKCYHFLMYENFAVGRSITLNLCGWWNWIVALFWSKSFLSWRKCTLPFLFKTFFFPLMHRQTFRSFP